MGETSESLTKDALQSLIKGNICAIQIPCFIENELSSKLANWFSEHPKLTAWTHEHYKDGKPVAVDYGVKRIGTPYNLTYGKEKDSFEYKKYYEDALSTINEIREACKPFQHPIETLLKKINHILQAEIAQFDGKPMFYGICRITMPNQKDLEAQPHFDSLPPHYKLDAQLSANIYLAVPENGGELELWNYPPLTPQEIIDLDPKKDWRSELGKSIVIKPKQGDLIIINTRMPHSICIFEEGKRISLSCFIGYKEGSPLMAWS